MMHCWINQSNGHALLDEYGRVVGVIIDLDRQMHHQREKRPQRPSDWFEWHVYKKREGRGIA